VPDVGTSVVIASGSGTQASNSRSTARLPGHTSKGADLRSSGMTHIDNRGCGDIEDVPDYEKFTAIQKEFWDTCTSSFLFGMQTFKVDIAQCMIAKDEYIIRKMEVEIVKSVKAELLQMGDINQRQKICLTTVEVHGNLLRTKPKD
jgi:hypothetical protein